MPVPTRTNVTRMPTTRQMTAVPQQQMAASGTQAATTQWICDCDSSSGGTFPGCAPPGWPPPGCPPWFSGMNSPPWYPGANAGVAFGTTAPANPVRGHFWWDGSGLWMFDGAVWVVVGGTPGAGSSPSPGVSTTTQMFYIGQSTSVTLTPSAWQAYPFTASPVILQGTWDGVTHKYTPNKAGYYMSSFFSNYGLTAAGWSARAVQQNDDGTTTNHTFSITQAGSSTTPNQGWLSATDVIYMNGTTDYLRFWVYDTTGTNSIIETVWHCLLLP
jgi:hypothetical protein